VRRDRRHLSSAGMHGNALLNSCESVSARGVRTPDLDPQQYQSQSRSDSPLHPAIGCHMPNKRVVAVAVVFMHVSAYHYIRQDRGYAIMSVCISVVILFLIVLV